MSWNKATLISTHDVTQPIIDSILRQGPRGHEFMVVLTGDTDPANWVNALTPIDSDLAEELLARGPRAVEMAKMITGYYNP